jgi:hypothetical protein
MRIRSLIRVAALLAIAGPLCALSAETPNPVPPTGTQGHDWDSVAFGMDGNATVAITAVNISTGAATSKVSFKVYVDGTRIDSLEVDGVTLTRSYFVRGAGRHTVLVACDNRQGATQVSCQVAAMRADEVRTF